MSCKADIEEQMFNKALSIATKGVNHTQIEGKIFYPVNPNGRVSTLKGAQELARRRVKQINLEFESGKYGKSATFDNGYTQGAALDISIQDRLINKTVMESEKANEMKEAMEVQRQDAERAGVDYEDRYKFDEMPSTSNTLDTLPTGYNFGGFLERKRKIAAHLKHRMNVLSKIKDKSASDRRQVFYMKTQARHETRRLKSITKLINLDVTELKKGETVLGNMMSFFHEDLKEVRKIMQDKNTTLEGLVVAQQYLANIRDAVETSLLNKEALLEEDLGDLPPVFQKMFKDLSTDLKDTSEAFTIVAEKASAKMLSEAKEGAQTTTEKEQIDELREMLEQEESNIFEFWLLPVDGDGTNAPAVQILVRKIVDDAFSIKETMATQQELLDIKKDLEKELPEIPPSRWNILGKFFTKYDYSIFKRVTENGNSRLVSKFSLGWEQVKGKTYRALAEIKSDTYKVGKNITDEIAINNKRKALFNSLKKDQVNFLDVRRLGDFSNDAAIVDSITRMEAALGFTPNQLLGTFNDDTPYKEDLIDSLVRQGGTRKSAKREYDKIVEEQKEKFHEFGIELQGKIDYYLDQYGVDKVSELPQDAVNDIQNYYFQNSPMSFSQTYNKTGTSEVTKVKSLNQSSEQQSHTMDYVSFLPTRDADFDGDFTTKIEGNEKIYRAWELFSDGLAFINDNRKYSQGGPGFVDSLVDVAKEHKLEMAANASQMKKRFKSFGDVGHVIMDVLIKSVGLNASKDKGEAKLKGKVKSIDEVVQESVRPLYQRLKAQGVSLTHKYKPGEMPSPGIIAIIGNQVRLKPITKETTLKQYIEDSIREDIFNSQDNDMIDSIVSQMEVVQAFKAKKEIETKINYFLDLVRGAIKEKDISKKGNMVKLMESFVDTHLYGVKERGKGTVASLTLFRTYSRQDLVRKAMLKEAITELQLIAANIPDGPKKEKMLSDIESLEANLENLGSKVTPGSVAEAVLLKARIVSGLGYNVSSQIMNLAIGNMAGRQNDGVAWQRGNYTKAHSYERWRKNQKFLNSAKVNENHALTDALINSLGVFQNSANEIVKNTTGQKLSDKLSPMYIIGETEKIIQRPQILSMLGDKKITSITDVNGNVAPIFDVDDHSNPHPAFFLENGVLKLKPEFDTQENRDTWITRSSKEYAETFGESGKIPKVIALINGDYRDTSSVMMKKSVIGAMVMAFKTWVASYYLRRFGDEKGIYTNLAKEGHMSDATIGIATKTALYTLLVGGSLIASPIAGAIVGVAIMGRAKTLKAMETETSLIKVLFTSLQSITFSKQFALNAAHKAVGIPVGAGLKMTQKLLTTFVKGGKQAIPDSFIDKVIGLKEVPGEDYEMNKARMHFLLTEIANLMQMLALKSIGLMLLAPDDEEDKIYKDKTLAEKFADHKATMLYYLIENMTSRFAADVSLDVDIWGVKNLTSVQTSDDIEGVLTAIAKMILGDTTYKSGKNKDRNRLTVQFEKQFVPKGGRELVQGKMPTLGFGGYVLEDYTPGDLAGRMLGSKSAAKTYKKIWTEKRAGLRGQLREEYERDYPEVPEEEREKEIRLQVNEMFPSINEYFYPSGEMDPDAAPYLEYLDE
jgi:hypothetical protein